MRLKFPKVYPITDTGLAGLSHAEQVKRLIAGGATLIQLRDKYAAPLDFFRQAEAAITVARRENARVIINDRVDLALALKADGAHVGQTDIPVKAARHLLGDDMIVGLSTHDIAQARVAARMPIDYVAFGPIFRTSTKENPDQVTGLDALREVRMALGALPLVAIGGITRANVRAVFDAGADSIAVISDLFLDPARISQTMRQMLSLAGS